MSQEARRVTLRLTLSVTVTEVLEFYHPGRNSPLVFFSTRSSPQNLERSGDMNWPPSPFLSALVSRIHVTLKTVHWQPLLWVYEAIFSMISLDIIPPRMYAFTSYFFVLLHLLFFILCFVRVVIFPFNILCFW